MNTLSVKRWVSPFIALVTALLLTLLCCANALADASFMEDHFEDYFKAKYGYRDDAEAPYYPTYLNYTNFSNYLPVDTGVLDSDNYVLHGSVSRQEVDDYIQFLSRFGYTVLFNAVQAGVQYVELHDINAPAYMPKVFRFFYHPEDGALLSVESQRCEQAYEQRRVEFWKEDRNGLETRKLLAPGYVATFMDARAVDEYLWEYTDELFCTEAFPSVILARLGSQRLEKSFPDGTRQLIMNGDFASVNGYHTSYWLLRVDITAADQPLNTDDWEFCISDEGMSVFYPFHIGNQLIEREDAPLLRRTPTDISAKTCTVWLAFPRYLDYAGLKTKLYISQVKDKAPLMDRVSFAFSLPGEPQNETPVLDGYPW